MTKKLRAFRLDSETISLLKELSLSLQVSQTEIVVESVRLYKALLASGFSGFRESVRANAQKSVAFSVSEQKAGVIQNLKRITANEAMKQACNQLEKDAVGEGSFA